MSDRSVLDAGEFPAVCVLWVVLEEFDDRAGVWVVREARSFGVTVAHDRFSRALSLVGSWTPESDLRVDLRDVACDGAVTVLRRVVVSKWGAKL